MNCLGKQLLTGSGFPCNQDVDWRIRDLFYLLQDSSYPGTLAYDPAWGKLPTQAMPQVDIFMCKLLPGSVQFTICLFKVLNGLLKLKFAGLNLHNHHAERFRQFHNTFRISTCLG